MNKRLLFTLLTFLLVTTVIVFAFSGNHFFKKEYFHNQTNFADSCLTALPNPVGYVNDFELLFTVAEKQTLDSIIQEHEKMTSNEIAIVTLKSSQLGKCNLDDFSLALARKWGIGKREKNNAVLIAFCTGTRKIRIQNGYGIEKIISDEETKSIIDNAMVPLFREQKYYEGTLKTLLAIIEKIK